MSDDDDDVVEIEEEENFPIQGNNYDNNNNNNDYDNDNHDNDNDDDDDENENRNKNKKGWEVEVYKPEYVEARIPANTDKIAKNDTVKLEVQRVALEDDTLVSDQKEDITLYAGIIDEEPEREIRGLNMAVVKHKLGEFLRVKCQPGWHYPEEKRNVLGIGEHEVVVFEVWIKYHDPYQDDDPKCCAIL